MTHYEIKVCFCIFELIIIYWKKLQKQIPIPMWSRSSFKSFSSNRDDCLSSIPCERRCRFCQKKQKKKKWIIKRVKKKQKIKKEKLCFDGEVLFIFTSREYFKLYDIAVKPDLLQICYKTCELWVEKVKFYFYFLKKLK